MKQIKAESIICYHFTAVKLKNFVKKKESQKKHSRPQRWRSSQKWPLEGALVSFNISRRLRLHWHANLLLLGLVLKNSCVQSCNEVAFVMFYLDYRNCQHLAVCMFCCHRHNHGCCFSSGSSTPELATCSRWAAAFWRGKLLGMHANCNCTFGGVEIGFTSCIFMTPRT